MDIDRRRLLAGIGSLGLTGFRGQHANPPIGTIDPARWHPLTRALDRARLAEDRPDRLAVERAVHELADAQGRSTVIKWMESPTDAFHQLSRQGLDALLQRRTASLWRVSLFPAAFGEDVVERSFDLRCLATDILRVDDWDRALTAPKVSAKSDAFAANASADAIFETRAVARRSGWPRSRICTPVCGAHRCGGQCGTIDTEVRSVVSGQKARNIGLAMPSQIDKLNVLRAAIIMYADSTLSDLRSIRDAKTLEEAQTRINRMIDQLNALSDAAETAGEERGSAGSEP